MCQFWEGCTLFGCSKAKKKLVDPTEFRDFVEGFDMGNNGGQCLKGA